jgi:hypothetical protein
MGRKEKRLLRWESGQPLFPFFSGLVILYDSSFETEFLRGINGGSFSDNL